MRLIVYGDIEFVEKQKMAKKLVEGSSNIVKTFIDQKGGNELRITNIDEENMTAITLKGFDHKIDLERHNRFRIEIEP